MGPQNAEDPPSAALDRLTVAPLDKHTAAETVIEWHYLHRRPPISYAFGLHDGDELVGVVTFGTPASRHLQMGACPSDPSLVMELNRLWVDDKMPRNTESWFVSRALRSMPPRIIVSYADTKEGHLGYIYRALNFRYSGWTDMDRKTPRFDYLPAREGAHSRDAFRRPGGYVARVRRRPKVRYWTTTGTRREQRTLSRLCGWPVMDWRTTPPPGDTPQGEAR